MPSLLSQFVPRFSSIAETVFIRCGRAGRDGETRYAERRVGAETRAAEAGGIGAGSCGLGPGIRGAEGWDEGTDGGVVCGVATGAEGFTSAGVFPAAGIAGFGSEGTLGSGGCTEGEGTDTAGGSLTGAGNSTCGDGTRISSTFVAAGDGATTGRSNGFSDVGAAGWTTIESCRFRSANSRWKDVCCRAFSSLSRLSSERTLLYLTRRMRAMTGVAIRKMPMKKTSSSTMGIGRPWECVFPCLHVRTTARSNLALCLLSGSASKLVRCNAL